MLEKPRIAEEYLIVKLMTSLKRFWKYIHEYSNSIEMTFKHYHISRNCQIQFLFLEI